MIKTLASAAAALLATTSFVAPAVAAPVTYTVSGTYTGTRDGAGFTTFATFTGLADTDDAFAVGAGITVIPLASLTAFADNTLFTVLGATEFFVNRPQSFGGFTLAGGAQYVTTFTATQFATYDGLTSISGVSGTVAALPFQFQTDLGAIAISDVTGITASAAVAAVPEPATWAMMIGGIGAVGGAMRRRAKVRVAFA